MGGLGKYLSMDDLWSVTGYAFLVVLTRVANPRTQVAVASVLASGMLAIFWLASARVRARNADRHPNARVALWALVAGISALVATGI